jgi:hypothetical protein
MPQSGAGMEIANSKNRASLYGARIMPGGVVF